MKKIILPVLILIALFSSCQSENVEYDMLVDEMSAFSSDLSAFVSGIDDRIADKTAAYDLLIESYETQSTLFESIAVLDAKLITLKDSISQDTYGSLKSGLETFTLEANQSTSSADEYYAKDVIIRVKKLFDEYGKDTDTVQSIKTYTDVMDEITSLEGKSALQNANLQGQILLLNSFSMCSASYSEWIISSETFASDSLLVQGRDESRALIKAYRDATTVYYETHIQGLTNVSSLDASFHENTEQFYEIFSPYTALYEKALESLAEALTH